MKTGGTTIRWKLNELGVCPGGKFGHKTLSSIVDEVGYDSFKNCFSFVMVRNPYGRIHSWYNYVKKSRPAACHDVCNKYLSFSQFVVNEKDKLTQYCKPLVDYCILNDKIEVDFIGRFENFVVDAKRAFAIMGSPVRITPSDMKSWKNGYSDKAAAIIAETYKKDFEVFEYSRVI